MTTFAEQVRTFSEKTKIRTEQIVRKVVLDMLAGIQKRSPVDEGRFRGSHRVSIDTPDLSFQPPGKPGAAAGAKHGDEQRAAEAAAAQNVLAAGRGSVFYITNNLPYAAALENGHSPQAPGPGAIYKATYDEVLGSFTQAVERLT